MATPGRLASGDPKTALVIAFRLFRTGYAAAGGSCMGGERPITDMGIRLCKPCAVVTASHRTVNASSS